MDPELQDVVLRLLRREGGDEAALALDRTLRPRLRRYFASGPWPPDEAEDLVQKTMLLVFQNVGDLEQEDRFMGWLYAIARNVRITERDRRRAERRVVVGSVEDVPEPGVVAGGVLPEDRLDEQERRAALHAAIETLAPRQRQCLLLRVRDELSYDEIANLLRLNLLTVRNHIAEAKKTLRRELGQVPGRETA